MTTRLAFAGEAANRSPTKRLPICNTHTPQGPLKITLHVHIQPRIAAAHLILTGGAGHGENTIPTFPIR